jgi:hypothetical protein
MPDHRPNPVGSPDSGPKAAVVHGPRVAVMDPPAWKVSVVGTLSTARDGLPKFTFEIPMPDARMAE